MKCREALRMSYFSPNAQFEIHDSFLRVLHKDVYLNVCQKEKKYFFLWDGLNKDY